MGTFSKQSFAANMENQHTFSNKNFLSDHLETSNMIYSTMNSEQTRTLKNQGPAQIINFGVNTSQEQMKQKETPYLNRVETSKRQLVPTEQKICLSSRFKQNQVDRNASAR